MKWVASLYRLSYVVRLCIYILNYRPATNLSRSFRRAAGIVALAVIFVSMPVLAGNKKPPLQPVNLNTAAALELQQVPGIGPSTTDKILKCANRTVSSRALTICARSKESGRSASKKCAKYVTVGKPVAPKKAANTGQLRQGRCLRLSRRRTHQRKAGIRIRLTLR